MSIEHLEPVQRDVLVVLALAGESASRSRWQDMVRHAEITQPSRTGAARAIYGEDFKRIVHLLSKAGFVVQRGGAYDVDDAHLVAVLDDAAARGRLQQIEKRTPVNKHWHLGFDSRSSFGPAGAVRSALARRDAKDVALAILEVTRHASWQRGDVVSAIGLQPSSEWLDLIDDERRRDYLRAALHRAFITPKRVSDALLDAAERSADPELVARAAGIHALRGESDRASTLIDGDDAWRSSARGFALLTRGRWDDARAAFRQALTRKRGARGAPGIMSCFAPFGWLAVVTEDAETDIASLPERVAKARKNLREWPFASVVISALAEERLRGRVHVVRIWRGGGWIDLIVAAAEPSVQFDVPTLAALVTHAKLEGYEWLEREAKLAIDGASSLRALKSMRAPWERALDALASIATATDEPAPRPQASDGTLVWTLDIHSWAFEPRANIVSGRSRIGKPISIARLLDDPPVALDDQDRRIARKLAPTGGWRTHDTSHRLIALFEGHQHLRDTQGRPITVVRRDAVVRVESTNRGLRIKLDPEHFEHQGVAISREKDVITFVELTPAIERVRAVLGESGLAVPNAGSDRAAEILAALSSTIAVHAPATEGVDEAGDSRVRIQLFRAGSRLRARLRVRPAGDGGAALRPGVPPDVVVTRDAAGLHNVRRDLNAEREETARLFERCPLLASLPMEGDDRIASDPATCLELLLELGDAAAVVEWPEGQPLKAPAIVRDTKSVRVTVSGGTNWLEVKGEVRVDEKRVVAMGELVRAMSRAKGRFVPIAEDEYVALTEDLRSKLEALARVQELASGARLSSAMLPALETITAGFDVRFGEHAARARDALRRAEETSPEVPRALAPVLRDYQRDGFVFLARRAEARLGACLADDMGLGKTIQALALLASRGNRGAALVVCPTSVCRNWEDEATRFAPTLRVRRLYEGDREETVTDAAPNDVVVASYGLLVAESDLLAGRKWTTVVFDEAHALKNSATRRWAAARALTSDATIGLTGTPLENHAGELHAIFDVLAPGVLGSRAAFDRVFGTALAQGHREAASALRQLVRPLLLRRTKSQVLAELPPKTEMTRLVEPSDDHRAFYEALRRRALERAVDARGAGQGRGRIEILAELMRLRRAAIDPRLVGGDEAPKGQKIEALARLATDLREEGHRALVFSQFLEVLDLAESRLAELGVTTLRLDGSMSPDVRAAQVAAFQAGRADVFLLSLKAGGVGMNLTAADYVIHLDPWWNPAVEDQATDRAHRIGQTRPITIIRLVTEGTIEEKVLALHDRKRKLYEDVVSAADGAGTLDVELLVELLGDGPRPPSATASTAN